MKIHATKKITQSGDSLTVNITKEVRALGLSRGDMIIIVIESAEDPTH